MVPVFCYQVFSFDPGMLICTCRLSIQEAEAGGLEIQDHPWLHIASLSLKKEKKKMKESKYINKKTYPFTQAFEPFQICP